MIPNNIYHTDYYKIAAIRIYEVKYTVLNPIGNIFILCQLSLVKFSGWLILANCLLC